MRVQFRFQVLEDLSSYESKAQSGYNPPIRPPIVIDPPRPPPPRPPPGPPGPPVPAPRDVDLPGGAASLSRRKRSSPAPGFRLFCWWPFFSGGTNSYEVFDVNTFYLYF